MEAQITLVVFHLNLICYHFENLYRTFKIYTFVPLKGEATVRVHTLRPSTNYTTYFLECLDMYFICELAFW